MKKKVIILVFMLVAVMLLAGQLPYVFFTSKVTTISFEKSPLFSQPFSTTR